MDQKLSEKTGEKNMPISYRARMKVQDDQKQTLLAPETIRGVITKGEAKKAETFVIGGWVYCPFCLFYAKMGAFLISTKKGFHRGLGKCSDCNQKMQLRTLTSEWTIEEYAEWCYNYSVSGFWQKVPYQKWSSRLKKMGWAQKFWNRYKALKGGDVEESPEEYYIRMQAEAYEADHEGRNSKS